MRSGYKQDMESSEQTLPLEPPRPATLEEAWAVIDALWAMNQALSQRVTHLEERLNLDSSNSSKPPSSNPPGKKLGKFNRNKGDNRKARGGQPGHPGISRSLLPPEKVTETFVCHPAPVCACGGEIHVSSRFLRHQIFEVPEMTPLVWEYQLHQGLCLSCCERHTASLPPGIPTGFLGPRALGLQAMLVSHFHLSKAKVQQLFADLFSLEVSTGALSGSEATLAHALEPLYAEAQAALQEADVVNVDETGFRQGNADGQNATGKKAWVWVAVSTHLTVFRVALSRGQDAAKALLGEDFKGLVGCDRWSGYFWLPLAQRAYCWAHLAREYQRIAQRSGESGQLGQDLLKVVEDVFTARSENRLATEQDALRDRMCRLLEQGNAYIPAKGETSERAKTARTCRSLLAVEAAYWTFADHDHVELTNNAAERAIRPVVVWRKVCYGTQSERGSRLLERVFTVTATCRQQARPVWQTLTQAIEAYLGKGARPSLIPSKQRESASQALFMQVA